MIGLMVGCFSFKLDSTEALNFCVSAQMHKFKVCLEPSQVRLRPSDPSARTSNFKKDPHQIEHAISRQTCFRSVRRELPPKPSSVVLWTSASKVSLMKRANNEAALNLQFPSSLPQVRSFPYSCHTRRISLVWLRHALSRAALEKRSDWPRHHVCLDTQSTPHPVLCHCSCHSSGQMRHPPIHQMQTSTALEWD